MSKSVAVIDKSSVPPAVLSTPAQIDLYKLIVGKLDSGDKITLEEAKHIWLHKVHRDWNKDKDGHPMSYGYVWSDVSRDFSYERHRMTESEITLTVLNWLTRNIGLLVVKGALKVIPMIDVAGVAEVQDKRRANTGLSQASPDLKEEKENK